MSYFFSKTLKRPFDLVIEKIKNEVKKESFGVLSEIDMQNIFKKDLKINFYKYKILGICNPSFAYQAISADSEIGLLLPCNIVVKEIKKDEIIVSFLDPVSFTKHSDNQDIMDLSEYVKIKLKRIFDNIK